MESKPRKSAPESANPKAPPLVADAWGPSAIPKILGVVAVVYLASIAFDGMGSSLPTKLLPRAAAFFSQCSCLFPGASQFTIEYRAEGYRCSDKSWVEIDPRPFFPIDRDEKESRFQRTMHFYKEDRPTMQALEAFMLTRQNEAALGGTPLGGGPIGGVRFLSLRIPLGKPGDPIDRYEHKPLDDYPESQRHEWYWTPQSRRDERCRK